MVLRSWSPEAPAGLGSKARGLLTLPDGWTPPFIAVTDLDSPTLAAALDDLIERAAGRRMLVRSDGPEERDRPGQGRTEVCLASRPAIGVALSRVIDSDGGRPAAVVQVAVEPGLVGMLSNERRLARRPEDWTAEGELGLGGPEVRRVSPCRTDAGALRAARAAELPAALARIAGELTETGVRRRVEWVWDGEIVWVVQADQIPEPSSASAPHLLAEPGAEPTPTTGRIFGASFEGRKLRRWRELRALALPRTDVAVLRGDQLRTDLGRRQSLRAVVEMLPPGPVVARTDVADGHVEELLLPTSAPTEDADGLVEFAARCLEGFAEQDVVPDDWALLCSTLVPARSSAFVSAAPNRRRVTVDAIWGYPDGLLHLPHDTSHIDGEASIHLRFKPACVLPEREGWTTRAVPAPWDWRPSLSDEEAFELADWARRLADRVGRAVQLMALVGVDGRPGPAGLRAFHFTDLPAAPQDGLPGRIGRRKRTLRSRADLEQLEHGSVEAIEVVPDASAVRDASFLRAAGAWAEHHGVPILFRGSLLGHAYHLLAADGAVVAVEDVGPLPVGPAAERVPVVVEGDGPLRVVTVLPDSLSPRRRSIDAALSPGRGFAGLPRVRERSDQAATGAGTVPSFLASASSQ